MPVAFEIIRKDVQYCEVETRKLKRQSALTKNELMRQMLRVCQQNQLRYRYVLTDNWFSSKENMVFVKQDMDKDFVMSIKSNRTVALTLEDKRQGRFVRVDALPLEEGAAKVPEHTVQENAQQFLDESHAVAAQEMTPEPEECIEEAPAIEEPKEANGVRKNGLTRYEELCKKPSMVVKSGDLAVMDELSDVLCAVSHAASALAEYRERFPDCMPPEKFKLWEDNLRDVSTVMLREFHNMRHGREKKCYDKKNVCSVCHAVFMVPVPGGVCDECRSKGVTTPGAPTG
ncbi:MAG: hypothetical protein HC900_04160 [Methylacidiphilales bacterium]|nr:hypothetical protein [Candidatus Methylacidiphilales bacterium]